jgi:transcriptional regulator with XRE-family HTH domain
VRRLRSRARPDARFPVVQYTEHVSPDREGVGEIMRRRRGELGLSLREAARRIGISPSYLVALEQGRNPSTGRAAVPSPVILAAIGDVLAVDLQDLLDACGAVAAPRPHFLLYQTSRAHRSPAPAARRVFAGHVDRWIEITDPRQSTPATEGHDILLRAQGPLGLTADSPTYHASETRAALARLLAEVPPQGDARVGLIFGANSFLLRSIDQPEAVLASEARWESDVAAICLTSLRARPTANICVYRDADLRSVSDRLDRLDALICLIHTHRQVAVDDGRGTVTTGRAAIQMILESARPAGITTRAWQSLAHAAATAPHALTGCG